MLLERGIEVSYETLRRWTVKFGPAIARGLRRRTARPGDVWHLDELRVTIRGAVFWLWRAVDQEGMVLDEILQRRRNKKAAKRLLKRLLRRAGGAVTLTRQLRAGAGGARSCGGLRDACGGVPGVEGFQSVIAGGWCGAATGGWYEPVADGGVQGDEALQATG